MGSTEVPLSLAPYDYNPVQPNDFTRRAIDRLRPIKVIVLGGGMSGIIAGILFPRSIENLELVIYEKNPELGGTWYESRCVEPKAPPYWLDRTWSLTKAVTQIPGSGL